MAKLTILLLLMLFGAFTVTLANQTTTWFDRFLYWNTETLKEPRVAYAANHHQQWFNRTGPGYVLKLFRLVGYNQKQSSAVWSPLALKLNLLALGDLDQTQIESINQLLFDLEDPIELNERSQTSIDDDTTFSGFTPRVMAPKTWREHLAYWWNLATSTLIHLAFRHTPDMNTFITHSRLSSTLKRSQLYEQCLHFDYSLGHTIDECAQYLAVPGQTASAGELTNVQKVALCREFAVTAWDDCTTIFVVENKADYSKIVWSTRELARHLVKQFHDPGVHTIGETLIANVSSITRGLIISGPVAKLPNQTLLDLWNPSRWSAIRSASKWTRSLPLTLPVPSAPALIDFCQEYAQRFSYIGKRNFYGPKTWGLVTTKMDTLFGRGAYYRVFHASGSGRAHWHTLVRIPYMNGRFSLVLLLPAVESTVPEMLQSLTPAKLQSYLKRLHIQMDSITLTLPRFSPSGDYDFRLILEQNGLASFRLDHNQSTLTLNMPQFIRIGGQQMEPQEEHPFDEATFESEHADSHVAVNRPFAYLIVGKYVDLYRKPAFDVLVAGYFNGPEN